MTRDIGVHGSLFGGIMLSWLDEAALAYACQVADSTRMVTRSMSEVTFERPVKEGRIVKSYGEVLKVGNTSTTISLEARSHNQFTGKQKIVCQTKMVFVQIDQEGDSMPLSKKVKDKYDRLEQK